MSILERMKQVWVIALVMERGIAAMAKKAGGKARWEPLVEGEGRH